MIVESIQGCTIGEPVPIRLINQFHTEHGTMRWNIEVRNCNGKWQAALFCSALCIAEHLFDGPVYSLSTMLSESSQHNMSAVIPRFAFLMLVTISNPNNFRAHVVQAGDGISIFPKCADIVDCFAASAPQLIVYYLSRRWHTHDQHTLRFCLFQWTNGNGKFPDSEILRKIIKC